MPQLRKGYEKEMRLRCDDKFHRTVTRLAEIYQMTVQDFLHESVKNMGNSLHVGLYLLKELIPNPEEVIIEHEGKIYNMKKVQLELE